MKLLKTFFLFATLFSLFTMNTYGQGPIKKYETAWKKVEDFVKKNLPKSALTVLAKQVFRVHTASRTKVTHSSEGHYGFRVLLFFFFHV